MIISVTNKRHSYKSCLNLFNIFVKEISHKEPFQVCAERRVCPTSCPPLSKAKFFSKIEFSYFRCF